MASALLRRFLKKPSSSPFRTLATSIDKSPLASEHSIPLFSPQNSHFEIDQYNKNPIPNPFYGFLHPNVISPSFNPSLQAYPSLPYAFCFNPISPSGFDQSDSDGSAADGQTVWADSVKRKRKRKMNKHKHKKLRKRLRRRT